MTRKQGITANWLKRNPNKKLSTLNETKLLMFEYNNYMELCYFCGEQAKTPEIWLNELIIEKQ